MEIVVVDLAGEDAAPLAAPRDAPVEILRLPGVQEWAVARRAGLERTTGPVVAFVEEHCFTEPGWAQALIEAHKGPWASVGYGFRNANPQSYVSRSAMLADHGLWLDPVPRGSVQFLPGNNVSYKRRTASLRCPQRHVQPVANGVHSRDRPWIAGVPVVDDDDLEQVARIVRAGDRVETVLQQLRSAARGNYDRARRESGSGDCPQTHRAHRIPAESLG